MSTAMMRTRRAAKRLAATLAVALAVLACTSCAWAAATAHGGHACCAAMEHDCGASALRSACCTPTPHADNAVATTWAAAAALVLGAPAAAPGLCLPPAAIPAPSDLVRQHGGRPPGVPTYLLVSSFRI